MIRRLLCSWLHRTGKGRWSAESTKTQGRTAHANQALRVPLGRGREGEVCHSQRRSSTRLASDVTLDLVLYRENQGHHLRSSLPSHLSLSISCLHGARHRLPIPSSALQIESSVLKSGACSKTLSSRLPHGVNLFSALLHSRPRLSRRGWPRNDLEALGSVKVSTHRLLVALLLLNPSRPLLDSVGHRPPHLPAANLRPAC